MNGSGQTPPPAMMDWVPASCMRFGRARLQNASSTSAASTIWVQDVHNDSTFVIREFKSATIRSPVATMSM